MTAGELFGDLLERGAQIWGEGDNLCFRGPKGALTPERRAALQAHKAELLAVLGQGRRHAALSMAQRRLWLLEQIEPANAAYYMPSFNFWLRGALDVDALTRAINEIVRRHDVLRTTFGMVLGHPAQIIHEPSEGPLRVVDMSDAPEAEREERALACIAKELEQPFSLEKGPLFRPCLLRFDAAAHVLVAPMHHIISDGFSLRVFGKELTALYAAFVQGAPSPLPPLKIQYADFAHRQERRLRAGEFDQQIAYWKKRLGGALPVLEVVTDRPRSAVMTHQGARVDAVISTGLTARLKALGQAENATLFMVLLAGFMTLLRRHGAGEDLIVGSPISGRNEADTEGLIGFFVGTLALRGDLSGAPSFRELLRRIRQTALEAYANQDVPFERIVEELNPERSLSHSPVFQTMFALQHRPAVFESMPGLRIEPVHAEASTAKFDLNLYMQETPAGLTAGLQYNTNLYERDTAERMLARFTRLLEDAVTRPDASIQELDILCEADRSVIEPTPRALEVTMSLAAAFERAAQATPSALAVSGAGAEWTYRDLDQHANAVARAVLSQAPKPDRVALLFGHGAPMIAAMLGALKAGVAYVPLDPEQPALRLAAILEDIEPGLIVCERGHGVALANTIGRFRTLIYEELDASDGEGGGRVGAAPDDLAYILYTSGSTGVPKGVMQSQRNALAYARIYADYLRLAPADRLSLLAPYFFDAAAVDIFAALTSGASLHLYDIKQAGLAGLWDWLDQAAVTVYHSTPSLFRAIMQVRAPRSQPRTVRAVVLGGEMVYASDFEVWRERFPSRGVFVNLLGASEASVYAMHSLRPHDMWARRGVSCGHAAGPGVRVLLADEAGREGQVHGEIVAQSPFLALGYWRDEERTRRVFTGAGPLRRYHSGDIARLLPDGGLEVLGRKDWQVKIRGVRVELAEVESALAAHPAVETCAAAVRELPAGEPILAAYYVRAHGASVDSAELRRHMAMRLPEAMIPAVFVEIDALPLTPSRKVDRRALPAPEARAMPRVSVPPRTRTEKRLAGIWQAFLGIKEIGAEDNFFELGGHSLKGAMLLSRVQDALGVVIPLRVLFETPTIAGLARRIDTGEFAARNRFDEGPSRAGGSCGHSDLFRGLEEAEETGSDQPVPGGGAIGRAKGELGDMSEVLKRIQSLSPAKRKFLIMQNPLSFSQRRLWFLEQLLPGKSIYNMPNVARLEGRADIGALERAFTEIMRRHEALRARFFSVDGEPVQMIAPPEPFHVRRVDVSALPEDMREQEARRLAQEEMAVPFDLAGGPLARATLITVTPDSHIIIVVVHHIVSDGWSNGVLLGELATLYEAFLHGKPSPLPELGIQYLDFARWQRKRLSGPYLEEQLEYWTSRLAGAPPLETPIDRPRPSLQSYRGGRVLFNLPADLSAAILDFGRREGATLFMVMLAAFKALLHRYSGQEDLVVGTAIANRNHAQTESLIGFFVNNLVMRTRLDGNLSFRELVRRVSEEALGAYARQDLPFEVLVERLNPERDMGRNPLFQVLFIVQNNPRADVEFSGIRIRPQELENEVTRFDMEVHVREKDGEIGVSIIYSADLFDRETIARLLRHYAALLRGAVAQPDASLRALPILLEDEERRLLRDFNDTRRAYDLERSAAALFEEQAGKNPERVAAVFGDDALTYDELNRRANQVARRLRRLGAGRGTRVGVFLPRSMDMLIATLAVMKAGAAYVPMDPVYPARRLAYMIEDAAPAVILTVTRLTAALPPTEAVLLRLDEEGDSIGAEEGANLGDSPVGADTMYVIFTSGSTGRPKGVAIRHRSFSNFIQSMAETPGFSKDDTLLALTTLSFDIAGLELFLPLITGGRVVIASREEATDPKMLAEAIEKHGVTVAQATPATWRMLDESGWAPPARLRMFTGGEAVPRALANRLMRTGAELWNLYGPTETTVWSAVCKLERGAAPISIGHPIANTQLYVVDRYGQLAPEGATGELCIAGEGLAAGYWNRPDLTAAVFVANPFSDEPEARMYRTGDLARFGKHGLEVLGRIDHQVKIRGFRIELGEVEAALLACDGVRECAVVPREDQPGDCRLVAYLVPADGQAPQPAALRQALAGALPHYMIPAAFVALDKLPLTPNGKVDRKALPAPDQERAGADGRYAAPETEAERALAEIWTEILRITRVGVDDNFFDLGGHSLLATQVMSRANTLFETDVPLRALFERPTIRSLAPLFEAPRGAAVTAGAIRTASSSIEDQLLEIDSFSVADPGEAPGGGSE